jgi:hypothetical protein
MYHFATPLIASIITTVLASGIAFMPTPAEAAKMSDAERVVLEKATAACKEEAKGMKFSKQDLAWRSMAGVPMSQIVITRQHRRASRRG